MKILIDMNLSPAWVSVLEEAGYAAIHCPPSGLRVLLIIKFWHGRRQKGYVLLTHDLDFGAILAATHAEAPSVIQIRTQDITPVHAKDLVLSVIKGFAEDLVQGALTSVDEEKSRVRLLPLRQG